MIRGELRGGGRHLRWHLRAATIGCPAAAAEHGDGPHYDQLRCVHQPPAGLSCREARPVAVLRRSTSSSSPWSSRKVRSRCSNAAPEPLTMHGSLPACATRVPGSLRRATTSTTRGDEWPRRRPLLGGAPAPPRLEPDRPPDAHAPGPHRGPPSRRRLRSCLQAVHVSQLRGALDGTAGGLTRAVAIGAARGPRLRYCRRARGVCAWRERG